MARSFFQFFAPLWCILFLSPSLWTHSQSPAESSPTYQLAFSVYPIGKTNWREIYYQSEPGVYETLTFWSYERSPKHNYNGPIPIEFYRQEVNPDPKGPPLYRKIATASPDSKSDAHLLFFLSLPPSKQGDSQEFQIIPLNETIDTFPLDTVTFMNATGANLEGVFGNKPMFLNHGISTPYDLKSCYKAETPIGLAVQYEGKLQKVLHSKWSFYPDYREIILLLPPKKPGSLRIQAFRISQHKEEIHPASVDTETRH